MRCLRKKEIRIGQHERSRSPKEEGSKEGKFDLPKQAKFPPATARLGNQWGRSVALKFGTSNIILLFRYGFRGQ